MDKKVKSPKFKIGTIVYKNFLKTKTPYKVSKREWREDEHTWAYKVDQKWWSESSITKFKKPRK